MDSLDSSESSEKDSWIDRFLSLDGNEFLCEVDTDYIQDSFNLYGLRDIVTDFKHALKTILDHYDTTASDSDDPDFNNARILYGLIHQRFILTKRGLDKMVSPFFRVISFLFSFFNCPWHFANAPFFFCDIIKYHVTLSLTSVFPITPFFCPLPF